tara:strand:+ start:569 stop:1075 length:507 start_codon:yes stop_codon:yes gene_type:complete
MKPHQLLSTQDLETRKATLFRCCGSTRWADRMADSAPFSSRNDLHHVAIQIWNSLEKEDYLEAFKAHPQIGASVEELRKKFQKTSDWSSGEQSGMQEASEETIQSLKVANAQYLDRFGYIFIVCATGKSAEEMLGIIQARLPNDPETELLIAAKEQEKITTIRLEKLL